MPLDHAMTLDKTRAPIARETKGTWQRCPRVGAWRTAAGFGPENVDDFDDEHGDVHAERGDSEKKNHPEGWLG